MADSSTTVVYSIMPWDQSKLGDVVLAAPAAADKMHSKGGEPTCTIIAIGVPASGQEDADVDDDECQCTAGWWLFGLGWLFKPLWIIGALLPVFDPSVRTVAYKRKAWLANVITLSVIAAVVAAALLCFVLVAIFVMDNEQPGMGSGHMDFVHSTVMQGPGSAGGGVSSSSHAYACTGKFGC